ncbi:hypothetical protein BJX61DRAFT_542881 [Aspergillus egyptiacus]|nr:hypothetical protein BJX61DRAFT_542881 [Aspergillus egyptiacus]
MASPGWLTDLFNPFSPQLIWTAATISVIRAIQTCINPAGQYEEYGLPLEASPHQPTPQTPGAISPLIYTKAIRDFFYGVILLTLRDMQDEKAMTVLIIAGAMMSLADGYVVWGFGNRRTAWRHFGIGPSGPILKVLLPFKKYD